LRHTFGTHAALFGVNPWRLQSWMGHKRIDETMIYVHVAENHRREIPECVLEAGHGEPDPDRHPQDARRSWQKLGKNRGRYDRDFKGSCRLGGGDKGDRNLPKC
jgi:hypothetical protein